MSRALRHRLARSLFAVVLLSGCAHRHVEPGPVVLSPAALRGELLRQLQRMGDLSGRLVSVEGGTIEVLTAATDNQACIPTQVPTALKQPLDPDLLRLVLAALETVNGAIAAGQETKFASSQTRFACSGNTSVVSPQQTVESFRTQMLAELQHAADLAAYVKAVDRGSAVEVWDVDATSRACLPQPIAVTRSQAMAKSLLLTLEDALQSFNEDLRAGRDPQVVGTPPGAGCAGVSRP